VGCTYGTTPTQNNNGLLITMTDGVGSENYTYDVMGRVTQLQKVVSGTTYTTNYTYNQGGSITSTTYPSGRKVSQGYDAIDRLSSISDASTTYVSSFAYNTAQQLTGFSLGNGVAASYGFFADREQLQTLSYAKSGTTLFGLTYGYSQNGGNNGQITSITDSVDSGRNITYTYDALERLTSAVTTGSANYPKWGLSFTYDRYGNRTAETATADGPPNNSVAVNASTNCLTGTGYGCDANGNMTGDGANTVVYDAENRATSVSGPYGGASYSYDGNGLRVKKQVSGGATTVYVFASGKVIAEYDNGAAPSSPSREYVYNDSQILATITGSTTTYRLYDNSSARVFTNASGSVTGQRGLYPYGDAQAWYETAGTTDKWKFGSYERDAESANDYAMARSYVNRLGRFGMADPEENTTSGNPQELNRYAYVVGDPVNRQDPSGRIVGGGPILMEPPTSCNDVDCGCDPFIDAFCDPFPCESGDPTCGGGFGGGGGCPIGVQIDCELCHAKCQVQLTVLLGYCAVECDLGFVTRCIYCIKNANHYYNECQLDCKLNHCLCD
jgi:RHS repeat-associated protein